MKLERRHGRLAVTLGVLLMMLAALAGLRLVGTWRAQKAYTPENLIRLHVVANSDAPEDQAVKYWVRDAVLEAMRPAFARAGDVEEARRLVEENLPRLKELAREEVRRAGKDYGVRAEVGVFPFPTRVYGQLALPAGNYRALRLVLGRGEGQNWWCVLFPPLCLVDFTHGESPRDLPPVAMLADDRLEDSPLELRLALLDWIRKRSINLASFSSWLSR